MNTLFFSENAEGSNAYNNSLYSYLNSTIFRVGRGNYCIHCGKKALLSLAKANNYFNEASDVGYRCNCNGATMEMIECVACAYTNPIFYKKNIFQKIPKEIYLILLTKLDEKSLPLCGLSNEDDYNNIIPKIIPPNFDDFHKFINLQIKEMIPFSKDPFFKAKPEYKFINALNKAANYIISFEESAIDKHLNNMKIKRSFF